MDTYPHSTLILLKSQSQDCPVLNKLEFGHPCWAYLLYSCIAGCFKNGYFGSIPDQNRFPKSFFRHRIYFVLAFPSHLLLDAPTIVFHSVVICLCKSLSTANSSDPSHCSANSLFCVTAYVIASYFLDLADSWQKISFFSCFTDLTWKRVESHLLRTLLCFSYVTQHTDGISTAV